MGLKQMIDKAMQGDAEAIEALPSVKVSGEAHRAYASKVRQWSGWRDATLVFGEPVVSPFASCHRGTHVFTANPERLLLNPNRVLLTVNPFRMRQEAVLTGALLHEAAHARHSNWIPRTEVAAAEFKHPDGSAVTKAELALAKVAEEARIEGIMAQRADQVGATGLAWTMRASAAHLIPMTVLAADPNQAVIDLVASWMLRAGRQIALATTTSHTEPVWVPRFTLLVVDVLEGHLTAAYSDPTRSTRSDAYQCIEIMATMCRGTRRNGRSGFPADPSFESDETTLLVDQAKELLSILFPETPPDQMPMAGGGCGAGEGEDEANVAAEMGDDSDEAGAGEPSEGEGEDKPVPASAKAGEGDDSDEGEGEGAGSGVNEALAKALAQMEVEVKAVTAQQGEADSKQAEKEGGLDGGSGGGSGSNGWRSPNPAEREVKAGAERFLRDMINPQVASKIRTTDQPSSMIDGAALAAWKAAGQVKAPRFFRQMRRSVQAKPPVKIAVLVDVSASMDELQGPSALLSWALAAACLDLRNFAGAGVQIESTLIHWGSHSRVIQRNGEILPGIREVACHEGTTDMHNALDLVAEQIPGFFDLSETPENRLLVQFTDWKLRSDTVRPAAQRIGRALEAGVNMLSVVPQSYSGRGSSLPHILQSIPIQRGRSDILRYQNGKPESVWTGAAKTLAAS